MGVATASDPAPKTVIPLTPGTTVHAPTAHIKVSAPKAVSPVKQPAAPKVTGPSLQDTLKVAAPGGTTSPTQFAAQQTAKSQSTLNQYLSYLNTNLGRVPPINYAAIGKQANSELQGMVSPLLGGYNQQLTSGTNAINQYTGELSTQLGNIGNQIGGIYNQAEQQQSALDTAIQAELAGNGGQQAAALQAALQNAGQDTSPATQAATSATGIAGAQYAEGSASLASLFGQGAAAQAYGATLPGIAKLSGLQALGSLQSTIGTAEQKAIDTAEAKYPTLVNQLTNTAVGQQKNAIAEQKNQVSESLAKTADEIRQQTADATTARVGISQQNANTSAARAATAAAQGAARIAIAQQNANTSAQRLALSKEKGAPGALTAHETLQTVQAWNNPKSTSVRVPAVGTDGKPVTNSSGVPQYVTKSQPGVVPPYSEQVNRLVAAGKTKAQAAAAVNAQVAPGENGRPWGALAASTAYTTAKIAKEHGMTPQEAYKKMTSGTSGHTPLPADVARAALTKVYLVTVSK